MQTLSEGAWKNFELKFTEVVFPIDIKNPLLA